MRSRTVLFAVDLVIVRGQKILFVVRKYPPFEGMLALPGGFVEVDETAEAAAIRELEEETGVVLPESELAFVKLSSETKRDPRGRVISAAYMAKVPSRTRAVAADDAREVVWLTPEQAFRRGLAFDHEDILTAALED
jgi:8-oxo-dGTP diphosphatase